ncbi:MAG: hypothetical protein M5U26_04365 [Planctomycetota bacterium]|nr:hypothetical protein [Planctomycetota bacterium]
MRILVLSYHTKPKFHHFGGALARVRGEVRIAETNGLALLDEFRPDLVVAVEETNPASEICVAEANRRGIPTLYVLDGIFEWRHAYENERFLSGLGRAFLQPLGCRHVTAPGPSAARTLAAWGYAERVVPVGLPRVDAALREFRREPPAAPSVLVVTPNQWYFNEPHRVSVLRAMRDLTAFLAARPGLNPVYRVHPELAGLLGVETRLGEPLYGQLAGASAVVGPPTTVLLEAMAVGLPAACLDYQLKPALTAFAWTVGAAEHLEPVFEELLNPPPNRMAHQRALLNDALYLDGGAEDRLVRAIENLAARAGGPAEPAPPVPRNEPAPEPADLERLRAYALSLERDVALWKGNYARLASAFPVNLMLWLRRSLKRLAGSGSRDDPPGAGAGN